MQEYVHNWGDNYTYKAHKGYIPNTRQIFFGDYDQTGSINIGKQADLLILNANPLSDIKNTEQIYSVVSNGKHYDKGELEKILEEMD